MPKLTFRGAYIRFFDTRQAPNGESTFIKINMSADFTDKLREAMGWDDLPDSFRSGPLDTEPLAVNNIVMKAKAGLEQSFDMATRHIKEFAVVRRKDKKGDSTHLEIDFQVVTDEAGAYTTVGDFISAAGKGKGTLIATYTEQATLVPDDVKATEEQRQGVLEEA